MREASRQLYTAFISSRRVERGHWTDKLKQEIIDYHVSYLFVYSRVFVHKSILPLAWVLGLGSWGRRRPDFGVKNKGKNVSLLKKSTWNEAKLQFSFIFAPKNTGRTPSHLWYFGQRCWLLFDLTYFFGYNTKLPLHMGRAERAANFLTVTDWVLGLGPPADAGSWVLGLQGTLGLGSWGQGPRPMSGGEKRA